MQYAPAAYILRAAHKDAYYTDALSARLKDVLQPLVGNEAVNTFEKELRVLADVLYYFFTTVGGRQTLGEEFCDLMAVHKGHIAPRHLRILQVLLQVCT